MDQIPVSDFSLNGCRHLTDGFKLKCFANSKEIQVFTGESYVADDIKGERVLGDNTAHISNLKARKLMSQKEKLFAYS